VCHSPGTASMAKTSLRSSGRVGRPRLTGREQSLTDILHRTRTQNSPCCILPLPKHAVRPSRLADGKDDLDRGARSAVAVRHGA
jgi:hypothetical protein